MPEIAREVDIGAYSAYAIAVKYGFVGTEEEWIAGVTRDRTAAETARSGAESAQAAAENAQVSAETSASVAQSSADTAETIAETFIDAIDRLPPSGGIAGQYLKKTGSLDNDMEWSSLPLYDGTWEITPQDNDVTLRTRGAYLDRDLVVKAVPNTYGHISYNGASLHIS